MTHDFEGFEEQQVFERALEALDLPVSEYGLDVGALGEALDKKGLSIEGSQLVKR